MTGVPQLERAALVARQFHPLPDHADAIIGALALAIIQIINSSPDDQAENLAQIARLARR